MEEIMEELAMYNRLYFDPDISHESEEERSALHAAENPTTTQLLVVGITLTF